MTPNYAQHLFHHQLLAKADMEPAQIQGAEKQTPRPDERVAKSHYKRARSMGNTVVTIFG